MKVMTYGGKDYIIEPSSEIIQIRGTNYELKWVTAVPSECMYHALKEYPKRYSEIYYDKPKWDEGITWKEESRRPAILITFTDDNLNISEKVCFKFTRMPNSRKELLELLDNTDEGVADGDGDSPKVEDVLRSVELLQSDFEQKFYDKMRHEFKEYEAWLRTQPAEIILEESEKYAIAKRILSLFKANSINNILVLDGIPLEDLHLMYLTIDFLHYDKNGMKALEKSVLQYLYEMADRQDLDQEDESDIDQTDDELE